MSLNDLAVLDLTMKHCKDEKVLMQSFLKTAMDELDLSRTKLLAIEDLKSLKKLDAIMFENCENV